jgi:hypothetical protein
MSQATWSHHLRVVSRGVYHGFMGRSPYTLQELTHQWGDSHALWEQDLVLCWNLEETMELVMSVSTKQHKKLTYTAMGARTQIKRGMSHLSSTSIFTLHTHIHIMP